MSPGTARKQCQAQWTAEAQTQVSQASAFHKPGANCVCSFFPANIYWTRTCLSTVEDTQIYNVGPSPKELTLGWIPWLVISSVSLLEWHPDEEAWWQPGGWCSSSTRPSGHQAPCVVVDSILKSLVSTSWWPDGCSTSSTTPIFQEEEEESSRRE